MSNGTPKWKIWRKNVHDTSNNNIQPEYNNHINSDDVTNKQPELNNHIKSDEVANKRWVSSPSELLRFLSSPEKRGSFSIIWPRKNRYHDMTVEEFIAHLEKTERRISSKNKIISESSSKKESIFTLWPYEKLQKMVHKIIQADNADLLFYLQGEAKRTGQGHMLPQLMYESTLKLGSPTLLQHFEDRFPKQMLEASVRIHDTVASARILENAEKFSPQLGTRDIEGLVYLGLTHRNIPFIEQIIRKFRSNIVLTRTDLVPAAGVNQLNVLQRLLPFIKIDKSSPDLNALDYIFMFAVAAKHKRLADHVVDRNPKVVDRFISRYEYEPDEIAFIQDLPVSKEKRILADFGRNKEI